MFKQLVTDHLFFVKFLIKKSRIITDEALRGDNGCNAGTNCPNYGRKWSCPPYSLSVDQLEKKLKQYDQFLIVAVCFDIDRELPSGNGKMYYQNSRWYNSTIKSNLLKLLIPYLKDENKYFVLGGGACTLCKPCKRKLDPPQKCDKNKLMSMESCGINVFETVAPEIVLERRPRYKVWQVGLVCSNVPLLKISCTKGDCNRFFIRDGSYHCHHHKTEAKIIDLVNLVKDSLQPRTNKKIGLMRFF